jgi:hypothetical protein
MAWAETESEVSGSEIATCPWNSHYAAIGVADRLRFNVEGRSDFPVARPGKVV